MANSRGCPRLLQHTPQNDPPMSPCTPGATPASTYLVLCDEAIGLHWFLPLQEYHVLQWGEGEGLRGNAARHWGRKDVLGCSWKPVCRKKSSRKLLWVAVAVVPCDRATTLPVPCHPPPACATRQDWRLPRETPKALMDLDPLVTLCHGRERLPHQHKPHKFQHLSPGTSSSTGCLSFPA